MKKNLSILIGVLLVTFVLSLVSIHADDSTATSFSGGSGTIDSPSVNGSK